MKCWLPHQMENICFFQMRCNNHNEQEDSKVNKEYSFGENSIIAYLNRLPEPEYCLENNQLLVLT